MKRICRLCIGILCIVGVIVGVNSFIHINKKYPELQVVRIDAGDELIYNDVCIQVQKSETIHWSELQQEYPEGTKDYAIADDSRVVHITLRLQGLDDSRLDLTELAVQNELASNQLLYGVLQEAGGTTHIELLKGEVKEVDLYFLFSKEWFYKKDWKNWETMPFCLEILNTYPTRYLLELELSKRIM